MAGLFRRQSTDGNRFVLDSHGALYTCILRSSLCSSAMVPWPEFARSSEQRRGKGPCPQLGPRPVPGEAVWPQPLPIELLSTYVHFYQLLPFSPAELRPGPRWGSLQRSPRLHSWCGGAGSPNSPSPAFGHLGWRSLGPQRSPRLPSWCGGAGCPNNPIPLHSVLWASPLAQNRRLAAPSQHDGLDPPAALSSTQSRRIDQPKRIRNELVMHRGSVHRQFN